MKRQRRDYVALVTLLLVLIGMCAAVDLCEQAEHNALPQWERDLTEQERATLAGWRALGD